jgi:hypothetical protein
MKKHWCCLHRELTRCSISINLVNSVWRGVHGQIWWWYVLCTQSQVVACVVTRGGCNHCTLEIKLNTLCMLYQDKSNHSWVHRCWKNSKMLFKGFCFFLQIHTNVIQSLYFFWTVLLSNKFFTGSTYFQVHYWYSFRFSLFSSMFPFLLYYVIML